MYAFVRQLTVLAAVVLAFGAAWARAEWRVAEVVDVAPVWAGHPVRFCLLTVGRRQYVALYDAERWLTVAARRVSERRWQVVRLPERVGWDSHNSIVLACDERGDLHLCANMHCSPLVYFRTTRPHDVTSFRRQAMVGQREQRCTYPQFLRGPNGELIFVYRDGASGNGERIWNVYQPETRTWRRLLDQPLLSGQGRMNAYPCGPVRDRHGVYHLCWVWRDTPDCATNHDVCYARSRDLRHWTTSTGRPLRLPITPATAEVVDPVPAGGGLLNSNLRLGFDQQDRPILSYHKYDAKGYLQLYNARLERDGWKIYQTSDWSYRWEFGGGGTIQTQVRFGPVKVQADGSLTQSFRHVKHGSGTWRLEPNTLKPVGRIRPERLPLELTRLQSKFPGMGVRRAADSGRSDEPNVTYVLRWETLGPNRDRPRPKPWPEPSTLQVVKLVRP